MALGPLRRASNKHQFHRHMGNSLCEGGGRHSGQRRRILIAHPANCRVSPFCNPQHNRKTYIFDDCNRPPQSRHYYTDASILNGIATFGGFWTFTDGTFAILFGANILYFLYVWGSFQHNPVLPWSGGAAYNTPAEAQSKGLTGEHYYRRFPKPLVKAHWSKPPIVVGALGSRPLWAHLEALALRGTRKSLLMIGACTEVLAEVGH
ncbi:hypothetical protein B0H14DRAFT_3144980 [Mycena olivaceomarginata]|nr:hypothetical protein B0H14DRAFT_3144980 [Mycena olivaceomarginata]